MRITLKLHNSTGKAHSENVIRKRQELATKLNRRTGVFFVGVFPGSYNLPAKSELEFLLRKPKIADSLI